MKFGEKVRQLREERGMSQQELAKKIGISSRALWAYENQGTYPRKREQYARIAEALGVPESYLLSEDEEFEARAYEQYGARGKKQAQALTAELAEIFAAGGDLEEDDMKAMLDALQEAFWTAKLRNKKYGRKKSQPEESGNPDGVLD